MNNVEFKKLLELCQDMQIETLNSKADEYATIDRLHNFKVISAITGVDSRMVAVILMLKNLISYIDALRYNRNIDTPFVDEKLGDPYNYLVLLRALEVERVSSERNNTDGK